MTLNAVHKALQAALDNLDNYEAVNRLNTDQIEAWLNARDQVLAAMGAVVAIHIHALDDA